MPKSSSLNGLGYRRTPTDAAVPQQPSGDVVAKDKAPKAQKIGNRWAGPAMVISGVIGLIWIVVFYTLSNQTIDYPSFLQWYDDLDSWNLVIGMGFIVAAFGFAMKWE
jgi:hypothetical protein